MKDRNKTINSIRRSFNFSMLLFFVVLFPFIAVASVSDGTIDDVGKYAWSENAGWLNFGVAEGDVRVTDSELTGYAWSDTLGWISLNCANNDACGTSNYGIANDGAGNLSGYAWSENAGWIDFDPAASGVVIDASGNFSGYAWGENIGWVSFNCNNDETCDNVEYKVATDWRPRTVRAACDNAVDDDGDGKTDYPSDPGCASLDDDDETDPASSRGHSIGGNSSFSEVAQNIADNPVVEIKKIIENEKETLTNIPFTGIPFVTGTPFVTELPKKIVEIVESIPKIFEPKEKETKPEVPAEPPIPKETPLVFKNIWSLLTYTNENKPLNKFTLAPLPREFNVLVRQFPELYDLFEEVGVEKLVDLEKLQPVSLTLPGLAERAGLPAAQVTGGKLVPPQGIPLAELSYIAKQKLPSEVVFARTAGELIDLNTVLSMGDDGKITQTIETVSGKPLQLAMKPDQPAKSVKGYILFRSKTKSVALFDFSLGSLAASLLFSDPSFAYSQENPVSVEDRLVLQEFEYTDPDGDGIYTAEINVPIPEGEYDIVTVISYQDPDLGQKEIRMTAVVDPEGYVFEKKGGKEIRIPEATVSLYWLNESGQYEIWPAADYQQDNPQTTDVTGKYSFLVPEGMYYLYASAPGYLSYEGEPFTVSKGIGIHSNIEMKTRYGLLDAIDWKTVLLAMIFLLLVYNFYRDRRRETAVRDANKKTNKK